MLVLHFNGYPTLFAEDAIVIVAKATRPDRGAIVGIREDWVKPGGEQNPASQICVDETVEEIARLMGIGIPDSRPEPKPDSLPPAANIPDGNVWVVTRYCNVYEVCCLPVSRGFIVLENVQGKIEWIPRADHTIRDKMPDEYVQPVAWFATRTEAEIYRMKANQEANS